MSCERSRGKLIGSLATVLNADPGELQRTYDGAAPSGSAAASEPLRGKVETVMSWFDAAGLTRPVHGDAHGLPRRAAWSGYAALHDHVMTDGRSPLVLMQRLAASRVPTATLARVDGDVLDSLFGDTDPFEAGDRGPANAVDGATGTDPVGRDREDLEIRGYTCGADGVWRDPAGFDVLGRDRTGRDRYGYDIQGTNRLGVNNTGRYPDGRHLSGYHPDTGLDADGFDVRGYRLGDDRVWRDREGFNLEGYDAAGYDRRGYDRQARHRDGRLHPFFSRASAQGIYPDGFDADGRSPQGGSSQVAPVSHLAARWSTARGTYDKRAARNGVPLHCPRCGQFVAKSSGWHACPKVGSPWLTLFEGTGGLGDRRLAQLGEPSEYPSLSAEAYNQRVDKRVYANGNVTVNDPSSESRHRLILVPGGNAHPLSEVCLPAGPHLPKEHLYTAAASPAYFPTVPGSAEAGYVLCTNSDQTERPVIRLDAFGFDPQGYDTQGYDADGFNRQGLDREGQPRPGPADAVRPKGYELNFEDATRARRILEGVAASFLGYDCAVELAPGSGQNFASLLESPPRIRIDNLPLGVRAHPDDNLVCARGLLDHELGHWYFTRPDVFGAAVRISQRELKVPGLDRMAPEVKSLNNLIEDGRMERLVAGLGVGFGQDLAALARMFPVWGETVGDMQVYADIRRARDPAFALPAPDTEEYESLERNWLYHQVSGALLVEALPFTQLRPEVVAGMHPRARQAVEGLIPVVRMGVSGNCQQGLRATIEVARYLEQAGIYPDEQADPTLPEGSVTVRDPGGWTKEFEAAGAGAKDNSPELSDRDILIEFERPVHIKIKGKPMAEPRVDRACAHAARSWWNTWMARRRAREVAAPATTIPISRSAVRSPQSRPNRRTPPPRGPGRRRGRSRNPIQSRGPALESGRLKIPTRPQRATRTSPVPTGRAVASPPTMDRMLSPKGMRDPARAQARRSRLDPARIPRRPDRLRRPPKTPTSSLNRPRQEKATAMRVHPRSPTARRRPESQRGPARTRRRLRWRSRPMTRLSSRRRIRTLSRRATACAVPKTRATSCRWRSARARTSRSIRRKRRGWSPTSIWRARGRKRASTRAA